MSSFDLIIEFAGMCLFVPHGGKVHVLMPTVHEAGHDAGHDARLFVHPDYFVDPDQPDSLQLDRAGDLCIIPLKGEVLNFDLGASKANAASIKGKNIAPLSHHLKTSPTHGANGKDKVKKKFIDYTSGGDLRSRVSLGAGTMVTTTISAPWRWGDKPGMALAMSAKWRIDGFDSFPLITFGGAPIRLAPPEGQSWMSVHIFNTSEDDHPSVEPDLEESDTPAMHFPAFYTLFDIDDREVEKRDIPLYNPSSSAPGGRVSGSPAPPHASREGEEHVARIRPGRRITCLMGEGDPEGA